MTAEHVKQENMESETMKKSHPHTLAEVTIQRGSSFTSLNSRMKFGLEKRLYNHEYIDDI